MNINISGHHIDVTESLQAYVESKMTKLERHIDNVTKAQVTLSLDKDRKIAEITLHVAGTDLHASAENDDMYAAIDQVTDKMDRQVLKLKEKNTARSHGQG